MEFEPDQIDVLLVLPGVVRSDDINRHLLRNEGEIYLNFEGAQPPEEVAASVVRSLKRNRKETSVGFVSRLVWLSKRFWPRVLRWIMKRKVQKFQRRKAVRQVIKSGTARI
jgi:short-subunit dehydrogenase